MPLNLRSTTLTAADCHGGIRVYTKTNEGDVREGCNDMSEWELLRGMRMGQHDVIDQGDGWFPGELRFRCSPDSTLCAFAWAAWSQSVFYQTADGCIRERRHLNYWEETQFVQPNCMMGTNIDAVFSSNASWIVLFFQDSEGYLCYRTAHWFRWNNAVRLQKAAKCTGIGATSWDDCTQIRVYFQDESNVVREYCGSAQGSWTLGDYCHRCSIPIGDISAVTWWNNAREIRVYFQEEDDHIIEWCWSGNGGGWQRGSFNHAALPHADIIAYIRNPGPEFCICVMWAGQDQILYQRVCAAGYGWLTPTPIAFLQATGHFKGEWTGTPFTDNNSFADSKIVRRVRIRSGNMIDGLALEFTDGSSTPWHGGNGGSSYTFDLNTDEDITQILVRANDHNIRGLQFVTSKGRRSQWYGSTEGSASSWGLDGRALAGFMGSTGQYVNGLMPFWSERYSAATLTNLESCVAEGERIRKEIQLTSMRCEQLRSQTEDLRRDIEVGLRNPADFAIQGVVKLIGSIEELYNETNKAVADKKEEVTDLVKACKSRALVVAKRFNDLHEQSTQLTKRGGNLSVEIVAKLGESETRAQRIRNLREVAHGLNVNAEDRAESMREKERIAEQAATTARDTRREAERKRESAKAARLARDIFTLGLGSIWDWGGLNEQVRYAEKLVQSCDDELRKCQSDIREARSNLSRIQSELVRFDQLQSNIGQYERQLQDTNRQFIALNDKCRDLTNLSFDISIFLSGLAARSETMKTKLTAAQFAKAVLSLQELMVTPTKVKGLLTDNPSSYESTLEVIARSDEIDEALGDMM